MTTDPFPSLFVAAAAVAGAAPLAVSSPERARAAWCARSRDTYPHCVLLRFLIPSLVSRACMHQGKNIDGAGQSDGELL